MVKHECYSDVQQYLKSLGIKIRLLREQKKLSQEKMSFAAGIHRTYLSDLELGTRNPTIRILFDISKALEVDITELVNVKNIEV